MRIVHRKRDGSMEVKYVCEMKDGKTVTLTPEQIEAQKDNIRVNGIEKDARLEKIKSGSHRKKDGFKPHRSFSTGEWIETRAQQKEHDKRHGLEAEAGDFKDATSYLGSKDKSEEQFLTDDTIKEFNRRGLKLTDNEAKSLQQKEKDGSISDGIYIEKSDSAGYEKAGQK